MAEATFFVRIRGVVTGPFAFETLRQMVRQGKLSRMHELSRDGKVWTKASDQKKLFISPHAATAASPDQSKPGAAKPATSALPRPPLPPPLPRPFASGQIAVAKLPSTKSHDNSAWRSTIRKRAIMSAGIAGGALAVIALSCLLIFRNRTAQVKDSRKPGPDIAHSSTQPAGNATPPAKSAEHRESVHQPTSTPTSRGTPPSLGTVSKAIVNSYQGSVAVLKVESERAERKETLIGMGFMVGPGLLITNHHAIDHSLFARMAAYFPGSGSSQPVKILQILYERSDPDLAILQVACQAAPLPMAGKSRPVRDQPVMLIENPGGGDEVPNNAVSEGVLDGTINIRGQVYPRLTKTSAVFSGGPVFNVDGKVIGVATARTAKSDVDANAYCLAVEDVQAAAKSAREKSQNPDALRARHDLEVAFFRVKAVGEFRVRAINSLRPGGDAAQNIDLKNADGKAIDPQTADDDRDLISPEIRNEIDKANPDETIENPLREIRLGVRKLSLELPKLRRYLRTVRRNPRMLSANSNNNPCDVFQQLVKDVEQTLGIDSTDD